MIFLHLIFHIISCYKIAIPENLINYIEPYIKTINNEIKFIRYSTFPIYNIKQEICSALNHGAMGIILPNENVHNSLASIAIIQSVGERLNIPMMRIFYNPTFLSFNDNSFIHIHPHMNGISLAASSFIKQEKWKKIVIVFDSSQRFLEINDLITAGHFDPNAYSAKLIRVKEDANDIDYGIELKHIKSKLDQYHIVINLSLKNTLLFLEQASKLSMCNILYRYVILHMDFVTLDITTNKYQSIRNCNITAFSLNDINSSQILEQRKIISSQVKLPDIGLNYQQTIFIDSLKLFVNSIQTVTMSNQPNCHRKWEYGSIIKQGLYLNRYKQLSGDIIWSPSTLERINYTFHIYGRRKSKNYMVRLAIWDSSTHQITNIHDNDFKRNTNITKAGEKVSLNGKHLKVTVYEEPPFVMKSANGDYEGYCIDLLKKISRTLNFTYTIRQVKDNSYGTKESNGKWSGMVGELQRGDADLAVTSLTISYGRSEVIDFTVPFMHLGISILFKKPRINDSDWFKFLEPLSTHVWMMTFAAYCVISLSVWIAAKISPYEQLELTSDGYESMENQFSVRNAFWFSVCSLMQQGSELCPRTTSTRIITALWWFFALILISSYTANLAAVLTAKRMESPIENADDLASQNKIKYGSLGRGSTMSFFNESKIETYERMWQLMSSQPGLFVQSSKEGIQRVKSSDYAYLMESSMLEYAVERDCELMQIGGLIDQKGYGIGLAKGSPYRELISTAILRLQEKTVLTELKEKWWKDKTVICDHQATARKNEGDDGEPIGGIFIILIFGLILTIIMVIYDLMMYNPN